MPKSNPLTQGLKQQTRRPAAAPNVTTQASAAAKPVTRSRVGRVLIGGHFAPEVQTALKIVAAEERTSIQALLAEGINAVFARRHKPEIGSMSTQIDGQG